MNRRESSQAYHRSGPAIWWTRDAGLAGRAGSYVAAAQARSALSEAALQMPVAVPARGKAINQGHNISYQKRNKEGVGGERRKDGDKGGS